MPQAGGTDLESFPGVFSTIREKYSSVAIWVYSLGQHLLTSRGLASSLGIHQAAVLCERSAAHVYISRSAVPFIN